MKINFNLMKVCIFVLYHIIFTNMHEITEISDFLSLLESSEIEHNNFHFNFQEFPVTVNLAKITIKNTFKNCKFEGKRIEFLDLRIHNANHEHIINFDCCEILSEIYFKDCFLQELNFNNCTKTIKNVFITPTEILYLKICGNQNSEILDINFTINDTKIIKNFYCDFINSSGSFNFIRVDTDYFSFNNNSIKRLNIEQSKFNKTFNLALCKLEDSYIKKNVISKGTFTKTDFGSYCKFLENEFHGIVDFTKVKNLEKSKVEFKKCNFLGMTNFNESKLNHIEITDCKFLDMSSFQDCNFFSCKIDRNIFEKNAFFDNVKIEKINSCNIRTIRNIKQQLNRTDNVIDYDKFKIYELNSYRSELKKDIKVEKKISKKISIIIDYTILFIGNFYSLNGRNWLRAIIVTLLSALLFYTFLFLSENFQLELDSTQYNQFLTGYFRYLLVTDYYNPLIKKREYLENYYSWIPFLLGKIFIAIGIYETIISFRKFKK